MPTRLLQYDPNMSPRYSLYFPKCPNALSSQYVFKNQYVPKMLKGVPGMFPICPQVSWNIYPKCPKGDKKITLKSPQSSSHITDCDQLEYILRQCHYLLTTKRPQVRIR